MNPLRNLRQLLKDQALLRLFKNSGILLVGQGIAGLLSLLTLAVTARSLGNQGLGLIILVQTYVALVNRLVNFQSWQAVIRFGAQALKDRDLERLAGLVKLGTGLDLATAILGTAVALGAAPIVGRMLQWDAQTISLSMLYAWTILFNLVGTPTGILRVFDAFHLAALQAAITAAAKLTAVSLAAFFEAGLRTYLLIWVATDIFSYLFLLAAAFWVLYRRGLGDWHRAPIASSRSFVRFAWWTNISSTADIPIKQLDIFIVRAVLSLEAVAIYKILKLIANLLNQFATPLYEAVYPQFAELIAKNQPKQAFAMLMRLAGLFSVVGSIVLVAVVLTSSWWLQIFGPEYVEHQHVLALFLLVATTSVVFIGLHPLFTAMGYAKQNFVILLIANLAYLAIAPVLGVLFGLVGIVSAFGVQLLLVLVPKLSIIRRELRTPSHAAVR